MYVTCIWSSLFDELRKVHNTIGTTFSLIMKEIYDIQAKFRQISSLLDRPLFAEPVSES